MRKGVWMGMALGVWVLAPGSLFGETQAQVAYPEGYECWNHVKSIVVLEGHKYFKYMGGFHHVYANDKALDALKQGKPFPKGAILVFELRGMRTENNAIAEGPCKAVGVMEKDPDRFLETEGWGFEDFKMKDGIRKRAVTNARKQCLSCHKSQKVSDYVFSKYHH